MVIEYFSYFQDYDEFFNYQEDNNLDVFFKLASPTEVSNATVEVTGVSLYLFIYFKS